MLRVRLLGDLEVWRGDALLPSAAWRTRQTLSVLRLLLHERDRVVPADRLIDAIWPDAGFDGARNNLHVAIRTLRGALEPGLKGGGASRYLRTEPGGYRFLGSECAVDVDDFLRLCQAGSAADGRGETAAAVRALREGLALYRGDYLADEPYADWAQGARERLRAAYLDATERLAGLLAAGGEHEEAIAHVERGLAIEPLREELYRRMMVSLAALGRRADALAAYERAEALLKEELGVAPSAATQRAREQLLAAPEPTRAQTLSHSADGPDELALPAPATAAMDRALPFVGRERDLAELQRVWALAEREGGHVVVLSGAAGAGKTRLAQRFAQGLGTGARTLWLTAHEAETGLPFAAPAALLSRWLEQPAAAAQVRRLGALAPVLSHLLPQTRTVWPECPPLHQEPQAGQVVETLTQALLALIGTGRALVVLDDAQWADRSTLLWLSYALRLLPRGTLAVVTRRTGEEAPDELDALLAGLRRAERMTELEVGALSAAEVETLVGLRTSTRESVRGVGSFVHEITGGHALFVTETLRELRARGLLFMDESGGWRVSPAWQDEVADRTPVATGVREAIRRRVARLEAGAAAALEAMAVLGVPCRAELVAEVTETELTHAVDGLDALLASGLAAAADGGVEYRIEHPVVQRAVYEALTPGRRQRWHARAAAALEWLEARGGAAGPAAPGQILRHLLAAGAATPEVVRAARRAGEYALARHAYAEAVSCFQQADACLAEGGGRACAAERAAILDRLAAALYGAGRWQEAVACYEQLLHASDDALARSRRRRALAQVLADVAAARFDDALALLDESARELEGCAGEPADIAVERGRVEAARSLAHFYRSDYRAAIEHGERALRHWQAAEPGAPGAPGGAAGTADDVAHEWVVVLERIGASEQRLGNLEAADALYARALARARLLGDGLLETRCLSSLGLLRMHRGALPEAIRLHEQALASFRALGVPRFVAIGLVNRSYALVFAGRFSEAVETYREALRLAEALQAKYVEMHVLVGLGEALTRLRDFDAARAALERGMRLSEAMGSRQRLGHARLFMAELELLRGDPTAARAWAEQSIHLGEEIDETMAVREGCVLLSHALLAQGEIDAAERAARRGLEWAARGGFMLSEGRSLVALSLALRASGRGADAEAALKRAEAIFRAAGAQYDLTMAVEARQAALPLRQRRPAMAQTIFAA